jgi:hypothetical protein
MKKRVATKALLCLTGLALLAACDGVETGTVSPCHGRFMAEGSYFKTVTATDGSRIVVSTMSAPASPGCGN